MGKHVKLSEKVARIPSWEALAFACRVSPLVRQAIADTQDVYRITSPLIAKGCDTSDIANAVRTVAMYTPLNVRGSAWYVNDFYSEHGLLPKRDDF